MRSLYGWTGVAALALVVGLAACSGDDGGTDPEPDPTGSVRVTVTADGSALAATSVRLYADGGATALQTAATAANGQVTFADLDVGAYDVDIVVPAGYELAAGQTLRRDVTVEEDEVATLTFALEEIVVAPTVGQIRARVTEGSAGVAAVAVNLYEAGGSAVLETLSTAGDGRALFTELDPGDYDVEIELPAGYTMAGADQARKEVSVSAGVISDVTFSVDGPDVTIVQAEGTSFSPASITVDAGTTVRWQRVNGTHTVTPVGHTEWSETQINGTNTTFEHTFDQVGEYDYECVFHTGMTGTVTVQ